MITPTPPPAHSKSNVVEGIIGSHRLLAGHIPFMVMSLSRLTLPILGSLCSKGWLCPIPQAFPFGEMVVAMTWKRHWNQAQWTGADRAMGLFLGRLTITSLYIQMRLCNCQFSTLSYLEIEMVVSLFGCLFETMSSGASSSSDLLCSLGWPWASNSSDFFVPEC